MWGENSEVVQDQNIEIHNVNLYNIEWTIHLFLYMSFIDTPIVLRYEWYTNNILGS